MILFCRNITSQNDKPYIDSCSFSITCWFCGYVMLELEKRDNSFELHYKYANRTEAPDGSIIFDSIKTISSEEWDKFTAILEKGNFWKYKEKYEPGEDGATWDLTVYKSDSKHSVSQWVPHRNTLLFEAGSYLISLTKIERLTKLGLDSSVE